MKLTRLFEPIRQSWQLMFNKDVAIGLKAIPIIALLYLLSPIDIIPDPILGLGQLDDIGIIILLLQLFLMLVPNKIKNQQKTTAKKISDGEQVWEEGVIIEEGEEVKWRLKTFITNTKQP